MTQELKGEFVDAVNRTEEEAEKALSNTSIRMADKAYRRGIEDLKDYIEGLKDKARNRMNYSAEGKKAPKDLDEANRFRDEDLKIWLEIRNESIKLDGLKERYKVLLGVDVDASEK